MASQAGLALTLVLVSVPVGADAEDTDRVQELAASRGIEGVWGVTVTLIDCDTGTPLAPPFRSLVTFAADGTIHESTGALGLAPEQPARPLFSRIWSWRTVANLVW